MLTGIVTWVLGHLSNGLLERVLDRFATSENAQVRYAELDAETKKEVLKAYVADRQLESTKWNIPWFWIAAAPILGSIGFFFVFLTAYNILWHANGIYPQDWTIAAYPGIYSEWATTAFNFIFAPALGLATIKAIMR